MTDRDDPIAPSSPASASPLRAPSEAAAELQARLAEAAAEAEEREEAEEEERLAAEEEAEEKRRTDEKEAVEKFARAPIGVAQSVRFFYLVMVFVLISMLSALEWFESEPLFPRSAPLVVYAVWAAVLAYFVIDSRSWRRRLPFPLEGFERISGGHTFANDNAPWIEVRVRIDLQKETRAKKPAKQARDQVLEVLAAKVHAAMRKDEDFTYSPERAWRVTEGKGLKGQYSRDLYRQRILERWLRTDVALLAKAYPIKRVVVDARYTGSAVTIVSAD